MELWRQISDFGQWLAEVGAALSPRRAPPHALGLSDGAPVLLKRDGNGYEVERPAQRGDKAPLFLNQDNVLLATLEIKGEAMLLGRGPARIEAAKRCPFPLDQARWTLSRVPVAWTDAAPWQFAAAPLSRIAGIEAALTAAGAKPLGAFAISGGTVLMLDGARSPRLAIASAGLAVVAAMVAAISLSADSAALTDAAEARLAAARADLTAAEEEAARAATVRETAAGPIRAAQAADTLLTAAPPVAAALAAVTKAMPDTAHARRLSIRPGQLEAEILAPDAAALARTIAADGSFSAARLKTAARVEAQTGLQRATLEILVPDLAEDPQ
ncbi:MAG: hypothetical protein AAF367_02345 [Pseudomonadota bacterium]